MTGPDLAGEADERMTRDEGPSSTVIRSRVPEVVAQLLACQPARGPEPGQHPRGRWLTRRWWRALYRAARRQDPRLDDPAWPLAQAAWIARLGPTPAEACRMALEERRDRRRA